MRREKDVCAPHTMVPHRTWVFSKYHAPLPRVPQSLLSMYGIDEMSDTDGEGDMLENPMSPEQIAHMRELLSPRPRTPCTHMPIDHRMGG